MNGYLSYTEALCRAVFIILAVCRKSSQQVACSHGWVLNGTYCYYVETNLTQKHEFWNARKWCNRSGSFLTSVLSQKENDFLDHLINETSLPPNETLYIGLRKVNDTFSWIDKQPYNYTNWYNKRNQLDGTGKSGNFTRKLCAYYNPAHQWQLDNKCNTKRLFICKQRLQSINGSAAINSTDSSRSISPSTATVRGTSIKQENPDETLKKLNEVLNSLEGAYFNHSSAERNMKELGAVLDSAVNPTGARQTSQSLALLSEVIKTGEKIGELMVKGLKRGKNITQPTSIQIQTGSITFGVDILPPAPSRNSAESVEFPKDDKQTNNINLPPSLMWRAQSQDGVSVVNLLLSDVSVTADPQANKVLSSAIISSTILFNNGSKFEHLSEPVVINFLALKVNASGSRTCVFLGDNESWSQLGCVVHKLSPSHTQCHCYHMTSFAVLMDVHGAYEGDAIPEDHEVALTIVSIVGCLIAFICYVTLLFAFYFLRRRTETLSIHMNLAAAESLAIFFFLVAYPGVRIKDVCFALAVFLHYFQLASFCWMLVEGINLLRGMVKVFRVTSRLRTYSIFAWGLPALVVAVTASISRQQYLRDNFCWISHRVIWSFAGPVALILLINLTVLVVAIKIVVKKTHYKETNTMSSLELEIRAAFKTLVILVPLLGVTWLLGFISIHNNSLVFQYLFAIINSMQGLYFLIAQYCFDDDIKSNAHQASNRMKRLFSLSTSKSTSSWSGTSNKTSADSRQQNSADQPDYQHNDKDSSKESSPDQDYNEKYLQSNLDAIASQLQRTETYYPENDRVDPAKEANVPKQHINETHF